MHSGSNSGTYCTHALWCFVLVAALCGSVPAAAQQASPAEPAQRPRIGLVLAGGGAKGIAHVGVLKVLEELNVPVDVVTGTSMGALVAGAYASGLSATEIERRLREADLAGLLLDQPPRPERSLRAKELDRANVYGIEVGVDTKGLKLPAGAIVGQKVEVFLGDLVGAAADAGRFDTLPIPYRAVATDIESGEMVVLDRGDLVTAMRASMAVPGAFSPVELDGRLLVDGGLVRNLPVDAARAMGADVIIAVNLPSAPWSREELASAVGITQRMVELLIDANVKKSLSELTERDVLIEPQIGDYSSANFREAISLIPIGEQAARASAQRLQALSLSPQAYKTFRAAQLERARGYAPVREVRLDTKSLGPVAPESSQAQVRTGAVQDRSRAQVAEEVDALMATDDYEQVRYRFVDEDGQRVLVLEPVAKSWGPNYLRFGLNLFADFEGDSAFNVLVDHRATWLNRRGLEWRNSLSVGRTNLIRSELYQPIDWRRRFFVAPWVSFEQQTSDLYVDNDALARYRDRVGSVGLDFGANFGRTAELRLGYEWARFEGDRRVGLPVFPDFDDQYGALRAQLILDRLDNWGFPTRGLYANLSLKLAREGLGGDVDFDRAEARLELPLRLSGRHRLLAGLRWGDAFDSSLPVTELFELGGFLNLSGYQPRQILSEGYTFGRVVYYYRLGGLGAFSEDLFLGASVEGADVRNRVNALEPDDFKYAGSLFFAADTALGPVYLGVGAGEDDNYAVYLFLGRP
jgi:NTE family protein